MFVKARSGVGRNDPVPIDLSFLLRISGADTSCVLNVAQTYIGLKKLGLLPERFMRVERTKVSSSFC